MILSILKVVSLKRIAFVFGILLFFYAGFQTYRANRLSDEKKIVEDERDQAIGFANSHSVATKFYINQYRQQIGVTKSQEITVRNLKALIETKELSFLKQFNGIKKDFRNLQSAQSFDFSLDLSGGTLTEVVPADTTCACPKLFSWALKDEYNDISATVTDTPKFNVRVPIHSVLKWERKHHFIFKKWKFGKKEWFQETFSPNKLVRLDSQAVFIVRKK